MTTVGIIAEFNPFHNGHRYIIEEAKRLTGADRCVIVMSGDFVQRGTPAVCGKSLRTKMALLCGADAVIELPVPYATASAEIFAEAGVKMLCTLGCIDHIAFGCETDSPSLLSEAASLLAEEPGEYREALRHELKLGRSFPAAREAAFLSYTKNAEMTALLKEPNNILALEYLKALNRINDPSAPSPAAIRRRGAGYHDTEADPSGYSSASAIRELIASDGIGPSVSAHIPAEAAELLKEQYKRTFPIVPDDLSGMLYTALNNASREELSSRAEISGDLANALFNMKNEPCSFTELIDHVKSKNNNYSTISRGLLHLILGIGSSFVTELKASNHLPYARLLGLKKSSSDILRRISDNPDCRLITRTAELDRDDPLAAADIFAGGVYRQLILCKYGTNTGSEFSSSPVIL